MAKQNTQNPKEKHLTKGEAHGQRPPSPPVVPFVVDNGDVGKGWEFFEKQLTSGPVDLATSTQRLQSILEKLEASMTELEVDVPPPYSQTQTAKRKAYEMDTDMDEDEDDDDDDDGDLHDPQSESLPRLPIYHPAFKLVEAVIPAIFEELLEFIVSNGCRDDETLDLLSKVDNMSKKPYGQALRLGLVGDAGAGKSAALNSILGIPNVTVEADNGASVTNVAIEFAAATETQQTPFAAEIEFFSHSTCMKAITDKFKAYFTRVEKTRAGQDLTDDENADANTAFVFFETLFCDHAEFSDRDAAEEFLSKATCDSDSTILTKLQRWAGDILTRFAPQGQRLCLGATTMEDLVSQYLPFIMKMDDASSQNTALGYSPWPFVRLVRVTMHHAILEQGVIIADLPGLTDYNKIRLNATNRYLSGCDITLCVGRIDRVEDAATFTKNYTDAFRRRRHGSVIFLITRSDDLRTSTSNKSMAQMSPQVEEILSEISKKVAVLEKRKEANKREIKKLKGDRGAVDRKSILNTRIARRVSRMKNEATEIRILARNAKVTTSLTQSYRTNTQDKTRLPVFCISNEQYMSYVNGADSDNPPTLSLANTQVPLLRSHIYAIPSKGKFAALEHRSLHSAITLLNVIQMSCSTSTLERKDHLVRSIRFVNKQLILRINVKFRSFSDVEVKKTFMDELKATSESFIDGAVKKCKKFENLGAAGHRAFIRNKGYHKTAKIGPMNWDAEFLGSVKGSLDRAFGRLIDEMCLALKTELSQIITEVMNRLDQQLRDDPAALVSNIYKTAFLDNLEFYKKNIEDILSKTIQKLQKSLREIHNSATTYGEDGYFTEEMAAIYENCNITPKDVPKGRGSMHRYRCEIFKAAVCAKNGPYSQMLETIEVNCRQVIDARQQSICSGIGEVLMQIQRNFEIMGRNNGNDSDEAKKFKEECTTLVPLCKSIIQKPVKQCLELCRAYK